VLSGISFLQQQAVDKQVGSSIEALDRDSEIIEVEIAGTSDVNF
jgi:hypothetical protein